MTTSTPQPEDLQQDCLNKLSQILDLVLKTAEAASADNNHKVVIQAAREATRITALMFKMTNPKTKTAPAPRTGSKASASKTPVACGHGNTSPRRAGEALPGGLQSGENAVKPEDFLLPDLDTLFSPREVASWDKANQAIYTNFTQNYREFQNLCDELAAGLPMAGNGNDNGTKG
jgi:hypothetical protein